MGQSLSCLGGPGTASLKRKVENGHCEAVLEAIRPQPGLLVAPCFTGKSTVLHLVARHGQTAIFTALLELVDELTLSTTCTAGSCDSGAANNLDPQLQTTSQQSNSGLQLHPALPRGQQTGGPAAFLPGGHARLVLDEQPTESGLAAQWAAEVAQGQLEDSKRESGVPGRPARKKHVIQAHPGAGCGPDWSQLAVLPTKQQLVNMVNNKGMTPLMLAASHGHADMVQILLQTGAELGMVDRLDGCTALHYACMYGHVESVRALLVHAVQTQSVSQASDAAATAPTSSGTGMAGISSGAFSRANSQSQLGPGGISRPTSSTARGSENGSDSPRRPQRRTPRIVNQPSFAGATPLHFAADGGHVEIVKLLCAQGADISAAITPVRFQWLLLHQGATPLHLAAEQGHLTVAVALLRHYNEHCHSQPGMQDPRNAQDRAGLRPHQLAFLTHHFRVALVIRPGYPLRWLFDLPVPRNSVPSLQQIAATACKAHLCNQLDQLEQAQAATTATVTKSGLLRSSGSGHLAAAAAGSPTRPSSRMQAVAAGSGVQSHTAPAGTAGTARTVDDERFRLRAEHAEADQDSIRAAAGLVSPTASTTPPIPAPVPRLALPTAQIQESSSAGATLSTSRSEIQTARGVQVEVPVEQGDLHAASRPAHPAHAGGDAGTDEGVQPAVAMLKRRPGSLDAGGGKRDSGADGQGVLAVLAVSDGPRSMEEEEDTCLVCFEERPRVRMKPCCHEICTSCARKVCKAMVSAPAACPFCRRGIAGFKTGAWSDKAGTGIGTEVAAHPSLVA